MSMTRENAVRVLAGTFVLASVALTWLVSPWWLLLAAFVGVNLIQSAFTHFCPAEMIFAAAGLPACGAPRPGAAAPTAPRRGAAG
jgi:hypothetical protein